MSKKITPGFLLESLSALQIKGTQTEEGDIPEVRTQNREFREPDAAGICGKECEKAGSYVKKEPQKSV